jgi:hypothetical protein
VRPPPPPPRCAGWRWAWRWRLKKGTGYAWFAPGGGSGFNGSDALRGGDTLRSDGGAAPTKQPSSLAAADAGGGIAAQCALRRQRACRTACCVAAALHKPRPLGACASGAPLTRRAEAPLSAALLPCSRALVALADE